MVNYEELGFKSGLEIHQQLDSHKLFCNCPSILRQDEPKFTIMRRLHAVAGEKGKVDVAAEYEAALDKELEYQGYDTTCLVELDEEPPYEINQEALKIALHISLLLNCKIQNIAQIMRKTVIDGSNTSGFQRTVMIARDGFVETENGKVGIESIFLEEDSARPVSRTKDKAVYKLDRLGIPLVEIATKPDIKNAEQAKEAALKIGDILRSCKVKRGIGTIRQDINISIKGSNRVELKGFQDPKIMIKTIENEVKRQLGFVKKGEENPSEVRNVLANGESEFQRPMPGSSRMYPETDIPLLKIPLSLINEVKKTLPKLRSDVKEELKKEGLSEEFIDLLFKQNKVNLYRELFYFLPKGSFIAKMLLLFPKEIAKRKNKNIESVESVLEENYLDVLKLVVDGKLKEARIKEVLERLVDGRKLEEATQFEKIDNKEIEEQIYKIIKNKPGLNANAYMGLVMKEMKSKVDGKTAMEIIKRILK